MSREIRSLFDRGLWLQCQRLNKRVHDLEGLLSKVTQLLEALNRESQCHHDVINRWLTLEVCGEAVFNG